MLAGACATRCTASASGTTRRRSPWSTNCSRRRRLPPDAKPIQYRIVERYAPNRDAENDQVVAALMASPASIAPKYFYDELGCALYGAICRLPEYYPTRTEAAIFRDYRNEIAAAIGKGKQFV